MKLTRTHVVIIGFISLLGFSKFYFSQYNIFHDIVMTNRSYLDFNHFYLDPAKYPVIGTTTEMDIYKSIGLDIDRRLTYKTIREKTINGTTFNYNKILEYKDTYYKTVTTQRGDTIIKDSQPLESSDLVIYLLDGKVSFFTAFNRTRASVKDEFVLTDKSVNVDISGVAWPDGTNDIFDYQDEHNMKHLDRSMFNK